MSHANAALTPRHRFKVARLVVHEGWPISEVAARFQVTWPTVKRWADRYRAGEPMHDRSSRPKSSPNRTSKDVVKRCVSLRMRLREGPVRLAGRLHVAPSTVHRILRSAGLNRLSYTDRATGEPVRRYEHDHPGSLVHVDVKKLGNIPDGGGWRYVGRRQGEKHRVATPGKSLSVNRPGNNGDSEATERTSLSCPKRSTPSSYANEQSAWSATLSKLTLVPAAASSAVSATNSV